MPLRHRDTQVQAQIQKTNKKTNKTKQSKNKKQNKKKTALKRTFDTLRQQLVPGIEDRSATARPGETNQANFGGGSLGTTHQQFIRRGHILMLPMLYEEQPEGKDVCSS